MGLTAGMSVLIHSFLFNLLPELTEVLSEDLKGPLQKVLDGIALLHLQAKYTQRYNENMKRVTTVLNILFDQGNDGNV